MLANLIIAQEAARIKESAKKDAVKKTVLQKKSAALVIDVLEGCTTKPGGEGFGKAPGPREGERGEGESEFPRR